MQIYYEEVSYMGMSVKLTLIYALGYVGCVDGNSSRRFALGNVTPSLADYEIVHYVRDEGDNDRYGLLYVGGKHGVEDKDYLGSIIMDVSEGLSIEHMAALMGMAIDMKNSEKLSK